MRLFYHHDLVGNFGDDLNAWLWPQLIPELLDNSSTLFVGIGSILDSRIPDEPEKVIFGTGIGYGRLPAIDEKWQICCVRGPLSAAALGLPPDLAITDPAALVSTLPLERAARHEVSFMPHHRTKIRASGDGTDLRGAAMQAGVNYIDPAAAVEDVVAALGGSGVVIAEAMHGAIVADALRVPWVPVRLYDHILDLKWRDWTESLGLPYRPVSYAPAKWKLADFLREVGHSGERHLSDAGVLRAKVGQLEERLGTLRAGRARECGLRGSLDYLPDPQVISSIPWLHDIQLALEDLRRLLRPGESFILVDEGRWGGGRLLAGRRAIPFLERNGVYWGLPRDDKEAISELERLRRESAACVAFARDSFWWLQHYAGFARHLRAGYAVLLENERVLVFGLKGRA